MKLLSNMRLCNDVTWLSLATTCRKSNVSEIVSISRNLQIAYNNYDSFIVNHDIRLPNSIFKDNDHFGPERKLLISYYESSPAKLSLKFKDRRENNGLYDCPYCGIPLVPDTLDHFIPKDLHPEFAIFPDNLVPQCRYCAPIKSAKYFSNTNSTCKFIHPFFFDLISNLKFKISCEVIDNIEVKYNVSFTTPENTQDIDIKRIIVHIKSLDIKNRIMIFCKKRDGEIHRMTRSINIKAYFEAKLQALKDESGYSIVDSNNGYDNWGISFYKSILNTPEVLSYYQRNNDSKKNTSDVANNINYTNLGV
ncbi:HNH endonuclease [Yersinia enterocolitica]|uniref:HNH endonuclease n=1 Tax=Yersinia enterocolitica TaxID=630 RepID=UPI000BF073BE|nr:HNH endonuclease [Yersinia enterocolitica]EKN3978834.1 HNH endonuclease [Yersinia enterocolitica]EKN6222189.1 HNH endonuclease [Yersinia enterocolitica]ELI8406941.1 HNH endonuclease [Yersinia enterocolitica]PNK72647.1 HNH endonuclease [Yersinia enterocolitica]HDL7764333.1 HNH endonuclease [Yersinia enterocolitica]